MQSAIAAMAVISLLLLMNLLFTYGLARRLKSISSRLAAAREAMAVPDARTLPPGAVIGDFSAISTTGADMGSETLRGDVYFAFFASDCRPCIDKVPDFVQAATVATTPAVAVIAGKVGEWERLQKALEPVASTIVESGTDGAVVRAFGVEAFPAFCHVNGDGQILKVVSSHSSPAFPTISPHVAQR